MTTTLEETATMSDGEVVAMRLSVDRELRNRGILRGDGPLSGAYAEYLASKYLGIQLEPNLVNKDFDGVDQDGQRVQIKARVVDTIQSSTSWDYHQPPAGFDVLLAFLLDHDLNVLAVFKMPVSLVAKLARPNRGRWSFRWNRALAKDPRVTVVPWPA